MVRTHVPWLFFKLSTHYGLHFSDFLTDWICCVENWYEERLYLEQTYQRKPDLKVVSFGPLASDIGDYRCGAAIANPRPEPSVITFSILHLIEKNEGARY